MEREPNTNRFYPDRPGVKIEQAINTVKSEPEVALSPEVERRVRQFEHVLTRGKLLDKQGQKVEPLEKLWKLKVNTATFYVDYLHTPAGRELWHKNIGTTLEGETLADIEQAVLRTDYEAIPVEAIQQLEKASREYSEARVLEQFAANGFASVEGVTNPTKVMVVRNPQELINKIVGLRQLKHYQRAVGKRLRKKLEEQPRASIQARLVMLTIHQRRTNELLADTYPAAGSLLQQESARSPQIITDKRKAIKENMHGLAQLGDERAGHFLARLDKFREGAGQLRAEDGEYTPVSTEIEQLAANLATAEDQPEIAEYALANMPRSQWESVSVKAAEWKDWAQESLAAYGLLSSDKEYDPDRQGRASDGLWQVAEDASVTNLEVKSEQGVILVPAGRERRLASLTPAGAVPVLDHEIMHVIQHENKQKLGLAITDKVGMDRSDIVAEAGAILAETKAQEEVFGQRRPLNTHYLRAVQAKLRGGSFRECMQAFFESMRQQSPKSEPKTIAKQAIDRTTRLFRNGGSLDDCSGHVSNSQPLVYLEQELLVRESRRQQAEALTMVGGTNVLMLAELRRVGMLDLSQLTLPKQRPSQLLLAKIRQKILQ